MFNFLKEKLKGAIGALTGKIEKKEEEPKIEEKPVEEIKEIKKETKKTETKKKEPQKKKPKKVSADEIETILKDVEIEEDTKEQEIPKTKDERITKKEEIKEERKTEEKKAEIKKEEVQEKAPEEKKGFFSRITEAITTKKISEEEFETFFWDMEVALLENNVAVEVIEKVKDNMRKNIVNQPIPRGKVEEKITGTLKESIKEIITIQNIDLLEKVKEKKPYVICFLGVNGSGKTTTIAKVAKMLTDNKMNVVLAAADTFRAAAIDQLELHGKNLGVKVIRHEYGADPAAVAFDAIKHAKAKDVDVVLIDTAGRLHSNVNLVDELKKIVRVAKPDLKIFVGESITGNDCVEQAQQFNNAVGIDGIILAKADIDEKGGTAISVGYVTRKPILYIGVGQEYADLQKFEPEKIMNSIGL